MFSLLTGVYDSYLAPTQLNVLVVGPSGVGKTTLLERLKVTQIPRRPSKSVQMPVALPPVLRKSFEEGGAEQPKDLSSEATGSETDSTSVVKKFPPPAPVVVSKRRFKLSICPAPKRYTKSEQDQEEDFLVEEGDDAQAESTNDSNTANGDAKNPQDTPKSPEAPRLVRCHSKEFELKDIDVMGSTKSERNNSMENIPLDGVPSLPSFQPDLGPPRSSLLRKEFEEYHLKPKTKMLPMSKIRPTIGSNLAKIDMYGAMCHFFDVGGKLQDLWERYYEDCDAVIFCWKLGDDPDAPPRDDEEDEENEHFDFSKQQEILNEVRSSISDDTPFLVLGHVFGNVSLELVDQMYSTEVLFPHYHNNLTGLCCGSAKTGAGVQNAMEWLIPLAKRQQKERLAAKKLMDDEKGI